MTCFVCWKKRHKRWQQIVITILIIVILSWSVTCLSNEAEMRVQFEVKEEEASGILIGSIPVKPNFTYRFNDNPFEFKLNSETGEVTTTVVLDRESLSSDRFDLVVLSSQPTYPIEVRIIVLDINDNYPSFPEATISVAFTENSNIGTRLILDTATDRDIGVNDVTTDYRIVSGNEDAKFCLLVTTNPSGETPYLHLETTGRLDREDKSHYALNISARDGGVPSKYGYLQVNIEILDVNDNPPIFDHSDYSVSVNESIPPGTSILQVQATDSDTLDNGKISYFLAEDEIQFAIDAQNGVITTNDYLNCKRSCPTADRCSRNCVFSVLARDHGSPSQDGRAYISVSLVDANDHDPTISLRYFPSSAEYASVDENAQNGSLVAAISVIDLDEGQNGETSINISEGNDLEHYRLESTSSFVIVRVNGILDREKVSHYNLTITAKDKGVPSRTATAYLIIRVNDVNDHEPVFETDIYVAKIEELTPIGSFVSSVRATDMDSEMNSRLFYSIVSGDDHNWFTINPSTGLVTTTKHLDREVADVVKLKIAARDSGSNPRWTYSYLRIYILDINDNVPSFVKSNIRVNLTENEGPTQIIIVSAADNDLGANGSVTYSLDPAVELAYPNTFSLDPERGNLSTLVSLDREKLPDYTIKIIAQDGGRPSLSSNVTISLHVLDVNDERPLFLQPLYIYSVNPLASVGTEIGRVTAIDRDSTSSIVYSLKTESTQSIIGVEEYTGILKIIKGLTTVKRTEIQIAARDKEKPEFSDITRILIYIKREDEDYRVEFTQKDGFTFHIEEDHGPGEFLVKTEIGRINLVGSFPDVKYYIISGDVNGWFELDEDTGILKTLRPIDREVSSEVTLQIAACTNEWYIKTIVCVTITDINDNHPNFISLTRSVHIGEDSPIGQVVYIAEALDPDDGENGTISYSLTSNSNNIFAIDSITGVVIVNSTLLNQAGTIYDVAIIARDSAILSLGASLHLTVEVDDFNNHVPHFTQSSYEISLSELTKVNTKIFQLQALDGDFDDNGRVSYFTDHKEKFGIFPDGNIYLKEKLDREMRDYYDFVVTAMDHGNPSRNSMVHFVVHILDENDNPPYFKNRSLVLHVTENLPPDTVVGRVSANDIDEGDNSDLVYSISTNQNDFTIDSKTGILRIARNLDREEIVESTGYDFLAIEAVVQDGGGLKDSAKITIYVTDENDNEPIFTRTLYKVQLSETAPIGTRVIKVNAVDTDEGHNSKVSYSICDCWAQQHFSINEKSGHVTLIKSLDREIEDVHTLLVLAVDGGAEMKHTATGTIIVSVLDENDNPPVFLNKGTKKIEVEENASVGSIIASFSAVDYDVNNEISYFLSSGNSRDTFKLNSLTGNLYLSRCLDREEKENYQLTITASDSGIPKLSTSLSVVITVIDINDNPPVFPNSDTIYRVTENTPLHTQIGVVLATDSDLGRNGMLRYNISKQEPIEGHFTINAEKGIIYTTRVLDRELCDTHIITVVCTDMAEPKASRMTSEKIVTIIVDDVNDNVPTFTSVDVGILLEGSNKGDVVMTLSANDPDDKINGSVTYSLEDTVMDLFGLDPLTGKLFLTRGISKPLSVYNITVRATDNGLEPFKKSSRSKITILGVLKRQDGPVFTASEFSGSVYENQPVGTSVLLIRAQGDQQLVSYYLTAILANGLPYRRIFDVNRKTGVISTVEVLESEGEPDVFELEVYAVEHSELRSKTAKTKVTITVLDENDTPPKFSQEIYHANVLENATLGSLVTQVRAVDQDTEGTINYILENDNYFQIQSLTGVVILIKSLDRENCTEYNLRLVATDGVQSGHATLIIQVTDINDSYPKFRRSTYSFDILENAQRNSVIGTVSAVDQDLNDNALITYSVLNEWGKDVFSLNPLTGTFTLVSTLDYEEDQLYIAIVQAEDSGHPSLSTTTTVYINIVDVNDNVPVFEMSTYRQEIYENITTGTSIVQVTPIDLDSGDNGRIIYSISDGDPEGDFSITSNGTILTSKLLDREKISFYNLIIVARDDAKYPNVPLSSTALVTIVLKDVNDEAPVFVTPNIIWVSESAQTNSIIMTIKATDKDDAPNSYVEYRMDATKDVFSLGPVDGQLKLHRMLDRETTSRYNITVWAQDKGQPARTTSTTILICVSDVNDNSPKFGSSYYEASLPEDSYIGQTVIQVAATDPDEGPNGQIRYVILSGNTNGHFFLDPYSGVVRIKKELDKEKINQYILAIQAEDSGDNIRHTSATLKIIVTDVNDNAPVFIDNPYHVHVMENINWLPINILTLEAEDADSEDSEMHYVIQGGDRNIFHIDMISGQLSMDIAADRESEAEYILTIIATDGGNPLQTGTATVTVTIDDVNDNTPIFSEPYYYGFIEENLSSGSEVVRIMAEDADEDQNGNVTYVLLCNHSETFTINSKTGIITTLVSLDREIVDTYSMTVLAHDCGLTIVHTSTVMLTVTVTDQNDNAPQFSFNNSIVFLANNAIEGQFVFGRQAYDADIEENGRLIYDISDSDTYIIDQKTGILKLKRNLDYNERDHKIVVHVQDSGAIPLSATYVLEIQLNPPSRFPHFRSDGRQFRLLESVTDYHVTTLSAVSSQPGHHETLKYLIGGGNVDQVFSVNPLTGEVRVTGNLDHERVNKYELWIQAFDGDLATAVRLDIEVEDINDNIPLFEKSVYYADVGEDLDPPQKVIEVKAEDADEDVNGQVSYQLIDSANSTFYIDSQKGIIYTAIKLDREKKDNYSVTLKVVDGGSPSQSSFATVMINVLDKNDNPPRFTRLFTSNVTENALPGTFVIHLTSLDRDIGRNANATYSFVENWGEVFHLDPTSGNVTVLGKLDRENREEYVLKVAAVDGSWRAETHLTVTIQDVNDNFPVFSNDVYHFNVPKVITPHSKIGQVVTSDRDKKGPHSTVTYSMRHSNSHFFIDPDTGEIFSRTQLNHKTYDYQYVLQIVATDHGRPPLSSQATVIINVLDENKNPPVFMMNSSNHPVSKDIKVDEAVLQLMAVDVLDKGTGAQITYKLTSGNGTKYFCIGDNGDWIVLCKNFEHEIGTVFGLQIEASDKGLPRMNANTSINLIVTGKNQHIPEFHSPSYQVVIAENEAVGSKLIHLTATDKDEGLNGKILYDIQSGNGDENFRVDPETGAVSIIDALDYEAVKEYQLSIRATDRGFDSFHAFALLIIVVTDVNDNPPVFNSTQIEVTVDENLPPGIRVTRVVAMDADTGRHAIIHYHLEGKEDYRYFHLDKDTGILTTKVELDYEQRNKYSLLVAAKNPDSSLQSAINIIVHVGSVNEYVPQFAQGIFRFAVTESSPVQTSVGTVVATDEDEAEDGVVYYLLLGGVNGFRLDINTGVVYVTEKLDRESQPNVTLHVLAKNYGSVHENNTDTCEVRIFIQDVNDPPVFSDLIYEVKILEDVAVDSIIIHISATDSDQHPQHNQITFSIASGNVDDVFQIDQVTGVLRLASSIDREKIQTYQLSVIATDSGSPPQTGTTTVYISLADVNDNSPHFDPEDLIGSVNEEEPIGTVIMILNARDKDLPPNSFPFKYYLVGKNDNKYIQVERDTGFVRTVAVLDRELTPTIDALLEVEDNGKLPMKSRHKLRIFVLDSNNNPPKPRNLLVIVWWPMDSVPGGIIANVRPLDPDSIGEYECKIVGEDLGFRVISDCNLSASVLRNGTLKVSSNDGVHTEVMSTVHIQFFMLDNDTIRNSITVIWWNITVDDYLIKHSEKFMRKLENTFQIFGQPLVFSVTQFSNYIQIHLAVRTSVNSYLSPQTVIKTLNSNVSSDFQVGYDPCNDKPCQNNGECKSYLIIEDLLSLSSSNHLVLATPSAYRHFECECPNSFGGLLCNEVVDPCATNPCVHGGKCKSAGVHYNCSCPPNYKGERCELPTIRLCSSNPCENGGTCEEVNLNNYFCLCRPGYRGMHCEFTSDICRPNRCTNGGICVISKIGYSCQCKPRFFGRHCEKSTWGFHPYSYIEFPPFGSSPIDFSITFSTEQSKALLMYSGNKRIDNFIAMEIVDHRLRFIFGTAKEQIVIKSERLIRLANWHQVSVRRYGKELWLSLVNCTDHGISCDECNFGNTTCSWFSTEFPEILNLVSSPLYLGGVPTLDVLYPLQRFETNDYVGCIRDFSVNGKTMDMSLPLSSRYISSHCGQIVSCDDTPGCGRQFTCKNGWFTRLCACTKDTVAVDCDKASQSISLEESGSYLELIPQEKYRRHKPKHQLSFHFKTLIEDGYLLHATTGTGYSSLLVKKGKLCYLSNNQDIIRDITHINIIDGQWHTINIEYDINSHQSSLNISIDGRWKTIQSNHNFLLSDLNKVTLGRKDKSFIGCVKTIVINNEVQTETSIYNFNYLQLKIQGSAIRGSCNSFQYNRPLLATDPLSIGIILVIIFFAILIISILVSFLVYRNRKQSKGKMSEVGKQQTSLTRTGNVQIPQIHPQTEESSNARIPQDLVPPKIFECPQRPDIISRDVLEKVSEERTKPETEQIPEHQNYNKNVVPAQTVDVQTSSYRYKGNRDGAPRFTSSLQMTQRTLSLSGELSSKILTVQDLQTSRLVSCCGTSDSTNLEADSIEAQQCTRNISLITTLDAISSSSEENQITEKLARYISPPYQQDSTTDESGNDSFTCSEFECDKNETLISGDNHIYKNSFTEPLNNERYSKLANNSELKWDSLLNWSPNYENLIGVCKDIGQLHYSEMSGVMKVSAEDYV